jgi:predicted metallopeptidase
VRKFTKYNKNKRVEWIKAPDIERRVKKMLATLDLPWIKKKNLFCFRSKNSTSRAYARIWGLSRIWQQALGEKPAYIIEVVSERFDSLSRLEQNKVLLHEIAHIPKSFSGSLTPHFRRGKRRFSDRVKVLVAQYNRGKEEEGK